MFPERIGGLTERLRYVFNESTLMQERHAVDDYANPLDGLEALLTSRRWRFVPERYEAVQRRVGERGVAVAGVRVMMAMDNLDTAFHPPHYVERYSASFYEKASRICHEHGSLFFIHACGHQRDNLQLVASLGVDGLEGVAFPTLGDVELDEAMRLSGDRLIITGGISAQEFERLLTREAVFAYVKALFGRMQPYAHRFMLSASCNTPYTAPWQTIVWFRDAWLEYAGVGC